MQAKIAFFLCPNVKRKFTYAVAELWNKEEEERVEAGACARLTLRFTPKSPKGDPFIYG